MMIDASRGSALFGFNQHVESLQPLSDAEFFAGIEWEESQRKRFERAARSPDLQAMVELLMGAAGGSRSQRAVPHKSTGDRQSLWSRHHLDESPRATQLIRGWDSLAIPARGRGNGHLAGRSTTVAGFPPALELWTQMCAEGTPLSPLESLVVFEMLRDVGRDLPAPAAAQLWRIGATAAVRMTEGENAQSAAPAGGRFLQTELRWQAGLLFAPVRGAKVVAASARHELGGMLLAWTDAEGVPGAEFVDELPIWLTILVRAREWGRRFARPLFDGAQETRFRALLQAISRLCLGNGRPALSNGHAIQSSALWSAVAASIPERRRNSSPALRYLFSLAPGRLGRPSRGRVKNGRSSHESNGHSPRKRDYPVFQSDASRLACLRSGWTTDANSLFVSHHRRYPELEWAPRGTVLLEGEWDIEVQVAGAPVSIAGPWICSCWYSEVEGDYLELQARPTAEIRIERQLLLARNDDLLFLADSVIGCGDARIDYKARLPLTAGADVLPDDRTRSCRLSKGALRARLFPLGLPCERVMPSAGQLTAGDDRLELRQAAVGALYAPLVIDWNPDRHRSPAIWRSLTVAQDGVAVPPASAAGCRLQVGNAQWLIYRSLSPILEPRTVLGQHTMYETMIGRFLQSGKVEPFVLVEQGT